MMRPGEPPTEGRGRGAVQRACSSPRSATTLSAVGRMKFKPAASGAPSEISWQLKFRGFGLPKEAEEDLRAYFKHAPELHLRKGRTGRRRPPRRKRKAVLDKMFPRPESPRVSTSRRSRSGSSRASRSRPRTSSR